MFAVLVKDADGKREHMFECSRYAVQYGDGRRSASLFCASSCEDLPPGPTVVLKDGDSGYVMNAEGLTVSVIRTARG